MKILRRMGLGSLYFIVTIILIVVATIIAIGGYFSLQLSIFCKGDYLLFVAGDLNKIPTMMIVILIIFILFRLRERFVNRKEMQTEIIDEKDEQFDIEDKELSKFQKSIFKLLNGIFAGDEKIFKIIKISYMAVLIVAIYFGMTSYAILYPESIKVGSPIVPNGVIYKYSDVKNVDVGISKSSKNSYSPYYKVIFNDGKSVDLFGATMQDSKGVRFEYTLLYLDEKLRMQGVVKNVDKEDFLKYSEGLDIDFVSRVEKLFDYK